MKKYLVKHLICCLLLSTTIFTASVQAQHLVFLFGHVYYASPVDNNFKYKYNFGVGAEGGIGVHLFRQTFLTGTAGFAKFHHSAAYNMDGINDFSLKIGLRQYIYAKMLFVHADAGEAFISSPEGSVSSQNQFSGDFGVGIKLAHIEILADFDGFNQSSPTSYASWIGIKAGFSFGL